VVILAAGSAQRMGQLKQVLPDDDGVPLVVRAFELACAVAVSDEHPIASVNIVTGHDDARVRACFDVDKNVKTRDHVELAFVHNPDYASGMGSSLEVGIRAAKEQGASCALVLLADQPLVRPRDLAALIEGARKEDVAVAAALYDEVLGAPACFTSPCFDVLIERASSTRGGARALLRSGALGQVLGVSMAHAAFDLDTPEDLERYRARHPPREA